MIARLKDSEPNVEPLAAKDDKALNALWQDMHAAPSHTVKEQALLDAWRSMQADSRPESVRAWVESISTEQRAELRAALESMHGSNRPSAGYDMDPLMGGQGRDYSADWRPAPAWLDAALVVLGALALSAVVYVMLSLLLMWQGVN